MKNSRKRGKRRRTETFLIKMREIKKKLLGILHEDFRTGDLWEKRSSRFRNFSTFSNHQKGCKTGLGIDEERIMWYSYICRSDNVIWPIL